MFGPTIELIKCQELYNLINEGGELAKISDPYYLYLIDCRPRADYNEGHIISAKNIKMNPDNTFRLPYEAGLHSRNYIVVYDSNSSNLSEDTPAIECAKLLVDNGSKYSVKVLKGGYEKFSKYYPFLRRQQIIYMPRELDEIKTYPSEIIPGLLYLGTMAHASEAYIKKDLKLKSYVDCTNLDYEFKFKNEKIVDYMRIPIDDEPDESIKDHLENACNFIDVNIKNCKQACLVYSILGISRAAAVVIAYLVYSQRLTVDEAFEKVSQCRKIQPQINFLEEIAQNFANRTNK